MDKTVLYFIQFWSQKRGGFLHVTTDVSYSEMSLWKKDTDNQYNTTPQLYNVYITERFINIT